MKAERLDEKGVKEIEPYASPYKAGIYSPDTSVIDSKAVVYKLRSLLESEGVRFFFNAPIKEVSSKKNNFQHLLIHTYMVLYTTVQVLGQIWLRRNSALLKTIP